MTTTAATGKHEDEVEAKGNVYKDECWSPERIILELEFSRVEKTEGKGRSSEDSAFDFLLMRSADPHNLSESGGSLVRKRKGKHPLHSHVQTHIPQKQRTQ